MKMGMSGDWRDRPWFTFAFLTVAGTPALVLVLVDEAASSKARALALTLILAALAAWGIYFRRRLRPRGAARRH
jgi:uncharacterized membrane protein YadS